MYDPFETWNTPAADPQYGWRNYSEVWRWDLYSNGRKVASLKLRSRKPGLLAMPEIWNIRKEIIKHQAAGGKKKAYHPPPPPKPPADNVYGESPIFNPWFRVFERIKEISREIANRRGKPFYHAPGSEIHNNHIIGEK